MLITAGADTQTGIGRCGCSGAERFGIRRSAVLQIRDHHQMVEGFRLPSWLAYVIPSRCGCIDGVVVGSKKSIAGWHEWSMITISYLMPSALDLFPFTSVRQHEIPY